MTMKINLISTDNKYLASDYTFTNLVDNRTIFHNSRQDVNIINKSKAPEYVGFKKKDDSVYGLRIVDDATYWYDCFYKNEAISFFIVSSYESYLLLTNELKCEKPVLYLDDAVMTPAVPNSMMKSTRIYTFCNPNNLDARLLDMPNIDIYTADSYFIDGEPINCNFRGKAKGKFVEWTPEVVVEYAKYKTAFIYYSKKHPDRINKLKSINRLSQCFYFNQEVVTNYPGRFHPDIERELITESIDNEFYKICGNTRIIYDKFFLRDLIKSKLINFCNSLTFTI
jgi:hypothetical protein